MARAEYFQMNQNHLHSTEKLLFAQRPDTMTVLWTISTFYANFTCTLIPYDTTTQRPLKFDKRCWMDSLRLKYIDSLRLSTCTIKQNASVQEAMLMLVRKTIRDLLRGEFPPFCDKFSYDLAAYTNRTPWDVWWKKDDVMTLLPIWREWVTLVFIKPQNELGDTPH